MTKLTTGLHQRSASFVTGIWELAGKVKTQVILLVSNSLNREGYNFFLIFKVFFLFFPEIFKVAGEVSTLTNISKYRDLILITF